MEAEALFSCKKFDEKISADWSKNIRKMRETHKTLAKFANFWMF